LLMVRYILYRAIGMQQAESLMKVKDMTSPVYIYTTQLMAVSKLDSRLHNVLSNYSL